MDILCTKPTPYANPSIMVLYISYNKFLTHIYMKTVWVCVRVLNNFNRGYRITGRGELGSTR